MNDKDKIDPIARAMALHSGWNKWDSAEDFCDTPSGNDPEDEREYWRGLASIAISSIANKAAEEGVLPMLPGRDIYSEDGYEAVGYSDEQMRAYARQAIAADRAARAGASEDARDAARYRWLRERMAVEDVPPEHPAWSSPTEVENEKFDAGVDAAMKNSLAKESK